MFKTLATATMALCFVAGAAIAQTDSGANSDSMGSDARSGSGTEIGPFTSPAEETMYQENMDAMVLFFTDDTMTTLKSDDEIVTVYEALGPDDQVALMEACEGTADKSSDYDTKTNALCAQIFATARR